MSEIVNNISGIHPSVAHSSRTSGVARQAYSSGDPQRAAGEVVSLTRLGSLILNTLESSSFRAARTQAIRSEIADGTFETPERIRGTVERLLDVIA